MRKIAFRREGLALASTLLNDTDELSQVFAALASPTRRAILSRLVDGVATVNELAEPFDLQVPAVSKHLRVLERAGLVVRARHAQYRPCAIDAAPIRDVLAWAEGFRPLWEVRLDRMAEHLARLQQEEEPDA
jgi:DNA-binding transcriptional ArsR family regulator